LFLVSIVRISPNQMKNLFLSCLLILICSASIAQHSIKVGTQIPIQYAIQYDYQFHPNWSGNAQVGVLTKPYDQAILSTLKSLGVDQEIVNVLTSAFNFGVITQAGANYHFKKNYVGITGSWMHLQATDAPVSAVEAAFGVSVTTYPVRPRQSLRTPVELTLSSDLFNAGILYGRRFTFKNPRIELHTEFGFAKTVASKSYIESEQRSVESLSALVDNELQTDYLNYGYLPSINIFFVYKLGKN
jgi:hypothetical protein